MVVLVVVEWDDNGEAFMLTVDRLCFICDFTRTPSVSADRRDNSAASTAAQTTRANC